MSGAAWGVVQVRVEDFSGGRCSLPLVQILAGKKALCKTGAVKASGPETASFGGEIVEFEASEDCGPVLRFDVRETKTFRKGSIGSADVPLEALLKHRPTEVSLALRPAGALKVVVSFVDARPLYGLDIEAACDRSGVGIPLAVDACVDFLDAKALDLKGIYRIPGDGSEVKDAERELDRARTRDDARRALDAVEASAVASALKKYFFRLPVALLRGDGDAYDAFVRAARAVGPDAAKSVATFRRLVEALEPRRRATAAALFAHLRRVADRADVNMMTPTNLGVCFGPTLFHAPEGGDPAAGLYNVNEHNAACQFLVEHYAAVFLGAADGDADDPAGRAATPPPPPPPADASPESPPPPARNPPRAPPPLVSSPTHEDDADLAYHFSQFDDGALGSVDGDGFEALAYCLGVFPNKEPDAFAACKADARGRFHAADVQRWWRAVRDGRQTPRALEPQAYTMVTYFLSFDEDKLGALDAPQFQNLYEGLLEGGYDLPDVAATMNAMDVSQDGKVSYAEFIAWFQGLLRAAAQASDA